MWDGGLRLPIPLITTMSDRAIGLWVRERDSMQGLGVKFARNSDSTSRPLRAVTGTDENGRYLTGLSLWKKIPSESEAGQPLVLPSPCVNLVRTQLLEPGTVVSALQRMNTRRNVFSLPRRPSLGDRRSRCETEPSPLLRH